jgi:hypothetical protein
MNIFRTPIFAFVILLILQVGNVAARVRGGLGEQYSAEIDQKTSNNHNHGARKLNEDIARGGKTGRRTNAEPSERELWWGGGHWGGGHKKWNHWGGGHKKHHWGHGWK